MLLPAETTRACAVYRSANTTRQKLRRRSVDTTRPVGEKTSEKMRWPREWMILSAISMSGPDNQRLHTQPVHVNLADSGMNGRRNLVIWSRTVPAL